MAKISIRSNKPLKFYPVYEGFVRMKIFLIQNIPEERTYDLGIMETCFLEEITESQQVIERPLGHPIERYITMGYEELDKLAQLLESENPKQGICTKNINEVFLKGFLLKTKQECEKGVGRHFSQAEDWVLEI